MSFAVDKLVLEPDDIDLARSPLAGQLGVETYCLGAFNPALTRLPNGNLLMMVRVAEALRETVREEAEDPRGRCGGNCRSSVRPNLHFVAVKSTEHEARVVASGTRQCFVSQRTQTINALRGHLANSAWYSPKALLT